MKLYQMCITSTTDSNHSKNIQSTTYLSKPSSSRKESIKFLYNFVRNFITDIQIFSCLPKENKFNLIEYDFIKKSNNFNIYSISKAFLDDEDSLINIIKLYSNGKHIPKHFTYKLHTWNVEQ